MSFTPIVAESQLEPEEDRGQLGASESRVIDTKSFRKCHISTTLNDLVPCQFIDGRDGKKRDACVMFFQFNFGLQKQGSDQRITSMTVEVNIEEGEEAEVTDSSTVSMPELEVKGRYPLSAYGSVEVMDISKTRGIELNPSFNGFSAASVKAEVERQYKVPSKSSLISSPGGTLGVLWQLHENEIHKSGVPAIVNCAVALQTDRLPFEVEILFSGQCPLLGVFRLKGKALMRIGKDLLWLRSPREDVLVNGLDDIDSNTFKEWVKTKTQNSWAEHIDYEP